MDEQARLHLQRFADAYRECAPEGWVRIVTWWAKLGDSADEASMSAVQSPAEVVVRGADGVLRQESLAPDFPWMHVKAMDEALKGEPEEGWLVMRVEIDADGHEPRVGFDHDTLVRAETSLQDPWADEVHHYLERHREELERMSGPATTSTPEDQPRRRWNWFRS